MHNFKRAERVAPLIKAILADCVANRAQDKRLRQVVITEVNIGDDLRLAKVLFHVLSGDSKEVQAALEKARTFLRRELGRELEMKYIPDLRFVYDDRRDHEERIDTILRQLREEKP